MKGKPYEQLPQQTSTKMAQSDDDNKGNDRLVEEEWAHLAEEEVANRTAVAAAANAAAAGAPAVATLAYSKITNPYDKPWDL